MTSALTWFLSTILNIQATANIACMRRRVARDQRRDVLEQAARALLRRQVAAEVASEVSDVVEQGASRGRRGDDARGVPKHPPGP